MHSTIINTIHFHFEHTTDAMGAILSSGKSFDPNNCAEQFGNDQIVLNTEKEHPEGLTLLIRMDAVGTKEKRDQGVETKSMSFELYESTMGMADVTKFKINLLNSKTFKEYFDIKNTADTGTLSSAKDAFALEEETSALHDKVASHIWSKMRAEGISSLNPEFENATPHCIRLLVSVFSEYAYLAKNKDAMMRRVLGSPSLF